MSYQIQPLTPDKGYEVVYFDEGGVQRKRKFDKYKDAFRFASEVDLKKGISLPESMDVKKA